jgi:hypothetical protein
MSHWLSWVAALVVVVGAVVGVPVGVFCAKHGAKVALELCAEQNGCALRITAERAQTTQDLEKQLQALHAKHPEILKARAEAQRILHESGEHPSMPEPKKP